jgi:hypothetical protein
MWVLNRAWLSCMLGAAVHCCHVQQLQPNVTPRVGGASNATYQNDGGSCWCGSGVMCVVGFDLAAEF